MSTALFKACLSPAGNGVHTVETAKATKQQLQQQLYQAEGADVLPAWQAQLEKLPENTRPTLLGICSDSGGGILRGANWGPLAIRQELYRHVDPSQLFDLGDVRVIPHLLHDKYLNETTIARCRQALYQDDDCAHPVSPLSLSYYVLSEIYKLRADQFILSLGGDHSISWATVSAYLEAKNRAKRRTAVIHFDAHTDMLPERLGIDLNFATWANIILPLLDKPGDLIQIGIRSSGRDKAYWTGTYGIQQYWADEVIKKGALAVAEAIVIYLQQEKIEELYVSFDVDAIDSRYVSATGTPESNGLTPEQALLIIDHLKQVVPVTAADIVEVAPFTGMQLKNNSEDCTVEVAASLAQALLPIDRK